MTLSELKDKIRQYQYFEDDGVIDVCLASVLATSMKLGDPIWMVIVGASSGGKSQILRPIAMTNPRFIHRVDDLTENTFLSGFKPGKGQKSPSLLHRIGQNGIIVISDFTVIFSKNSEAKNAILSQIRMIYDGEMIKHSGTTDEPITWKGELGVLAGSTPSVYRHFEEVADMGQRFICYRMKEYDPEKATKLALSRPLYGKKLDEALSESYAEYIQGAIDGWKKSGKTIDLPPEVFERIVKIALFAEKIRTTVSVDKWKREITEKPVPAFPMRTSLQLTALSRALYVMRGGNLGEADLAIIDWCGYSLANEEKRGVLKILAGVRWGLGVSTQRVADILGLSTSVTGNILQNLSAVGVLIREGGQGSLAWRFAREEDYLLVRRIEGIAGEAVDISERELSTEEKGEMEKAADDEFERWGQGSIIN
jgi:hypothetical protein